MRINVSEATAGPPAFAIHCFRSEDSEKGSIASDGSDVAEMYDDFVYTPTNGLLGAYWRTPQVEYLMLSLGRLLYIANSEYSSFTVWTTRVSNPV